MYRVLAQLARSGAVTLVLTAFINGANAQTTVDFQNGFGGYNSTQDADPRANFPNLPFGNGADVQVDANNNIFFPFFGSIEEGQGLLRFDNLFGNAANQIPLGSVITNAVLTLNVFDATDANATVAFHRMLLLMPLLLSIECF